MDINADTSRRKLMAVAVMGAGGLLIESNRAVAASTAPDTSRALAPTPTVGFPRQAWASKDNRIALKAPAAVRSTGNALDYLLINEQFGRFGMAHDELQIDVLRQLFAKNAKLELMRGVGQPFATYDGVDAIVKNFERVLRFQADQRRHCMSNILIEDLTRNTAQALAYGIVTIAHNGLSIGATVVYSAQFVRDSGQSWQFSKLMIGMDDYAAALPPPPK